MTAGEGARGEGALFFRVVCTGDSGAKGTIVRNHGAGEKMRTGIMGTCWRLLLQKFRNPGVHAVEGDLLDIGEA